MYVTPSSGFAQKPTVLLVDDSPDNIALLSALQIAAAEYSP